MRQYQIVEVNYEEHTIEFEVVCSVLGSNRPATRYEPPEYEEIEIEKVRLINLTNFEGKPVFDQELIDEALNQIDMVKVEEEIWRGDDYEV